MIFTLVVPRLPRKTSIMLDSNVVMCVFAWGVPRFWPKQLSLEIAKPNVIGSFIVNPRRFKLLLFVAGAVFGKPLAPFFCGMRTIWWTLSSIFSWQEQDLVNLRFHFVVAGAVFDEPLMFFWMVKCKWTTKRCLRPFKGGVARPHFSHKQALQILYRQPPLNGPLQCFVCITKNHEVQEMFDRSARPAEQLEQLPTGGPWKLSRNSEIQNAQEKHSPHSFPLEKNHLEEGEIPDLPSPRCQGLCLQRFLAAEPRLGEASHLGEKHRGSGGKNTCLRWKNGGFW